MHDLLDHLERHGFARAPGARGFDDLRREVLTFVAGETVGDVRPWPAWVHREETLRQVGVWLRDYHRAVADFVPPPDARWREGGRWEPGLIVGHGDPAPYNAAWKSEKLAGFFDFDNAGPISREDDMAWVAFAWTPLHAREVVETEGFTAFGERRGRLAAFLAAYGWGGTVEEALALVDARLSRQIEAMHATAEQGDPAYRAMIERGQDRLLESARRALSQV